MIYYYKFKNCNKIIFYNKINFILINLYFKHNEIISNYKNKSLFIIDSSIFE